MDRDGDECMVCCVMCLGLAAVLVSAPVMFVCLCVCVCA